MGRFFPLMMLLVGLGIAKIPPKNGWQTGTLVEAVRFPRYCIIGDCREPVDGQRVIIETNEVRLTAEHPMIRHPNVVIGGPIRYVVIKQTLWIRDEEGRVFEFKLTRREVR